MKKVNQLNKIEVRDELYLYIDIDTLLSGTFEESAKKILELKDRLKKECPAFDNGSKKFNDYIRFELKYTNFYSDYSPELSIIGIRLETDEEFEARLKRSENARLAGIASAKKRKQETKAQELALLEKLKKKYGK